MLWEETKHGWPPNIWAEAGPWHMIARGCGAHQSLTITHIFTWLDVKARSEASQAHLELMFCRHVTEGDFISSSPV